MINGNFINRTIENHPVGGVRPTQQVTVKLVNRDSVNSSTVLVQGYFLNGTRTLYVLEVVSLTPMKLRREIILPILMHFNSFLQQVVQQQKVLKFQFGEKCVWTVSNSSSSCIG
jgi:hypothetical protein